MHVARGQYLALSEGFTCVCVCVCGAEIHWRRRWQK